MLREVTEWAERLREGAINRKAATAEQVAAIWPGGSNNKSTGVTGWLKYFLNVGRFSAILDLRAEMRGQKSQEHQDTIRKIIGDEPESVELTVKDENGDPVIALVYPKSDLALREIHKRHLALAELIDSTQQITANPTAASDLDLVSRSLDEQGYLQRLLCWICTTEGVGLPFAERTPRPTVPAEFDPWSTVDFYSIAQTFQRVNIVRLSVLEASSDPKRSPDWGVFWAGNEERLHIPAAHLMRDASLPALIATAAESSRAHREAREAAEEKAKPQHPPMKLPIRNG